MTSTLRALGLSLVGMMAVGCAGQGGRGSYAAPRPYDAHHAGPRLQVAQLYLPGWKQAAPVYFENRAGMAVTEGDIMLGPVHAVQQMYGAPRIPHTGAFHAVASDSKSHLWPGGVIPFEIDASVTATRRGYIDWAINHYNSTSVVSLRPRTPADEDFVRFTEASEGYGCWSWIGRTGGEQEIRVSDCANGKSA